MLGRTNTGGGSGSGSGGGLNFQVVGNPQPSNPKENTIWIDTDTKITSYIFSATEPEAPADGLDGPVWISTGTASPAPFNALKKNTIQVYPLSAKQYVSGSWVTKTAKSYQGGKWVEWVTYLYSAGNKMVTFTDGNNGNGANTTTWGETGVTVYIISTQSNGRASRWFYTNDIQGTAKGKNLVVKYEGFSGTYGTSSYLVAGISSASAPALDTNGDISSSIASQRISTPFNASSGTLTVDLSGVTADGRVIVGISNNSANYGIKSTTVTITDIYIE